MARVPQAPRARAALLGQPALLAHRNPDADAARAGREAEALAAFGQTVANTAFELAERQQTARRETALSGAVTEATRRLGALQLELDRDPDFATRGQRFDAGAVEVRQRLMQDLDEETQARFAGRFDRFAVTQGLAVRRRASVQEIEFQQAALEDGTAELLETALAAEDETGAQVARDQIVDNIERARRAGIVDARSARRLRDNRLGTYDLTRLERLMGEDPRGAVIALEAGAFENIEPLQRAQRLGAARRAARAEIRLARLEIRPAVDAWEAARIRGDTVAGQAALFARVEAIDPELHARMVRREAAFQEGEAVARLGARQQRRFLQERYGDGAGGTRPLTGGESAERARLEAIVDAAESDRAALRRLIARALDSPHAELAGGARASDLLEGMTDRERDARLDGAEALAGDLARLRQVWEAGLEPEDEGELIDRARALFGEDIAAALQEEAAYFETVRAFPEMSLTDRQLVLARADPGAFSPEEAMRHDVLLKMHARDAKEQREDPAGYYTRRDPVLRAAYAAFADSAAALASNPGDPAARAAFTQAQVAALEGVLQKQRLDGVPEHRRRLLPAAAAQEWADRLTAMPAPQALAAAQGLAREYGPYWPRVFGEIAGADRLAPEYRILAGMTKPGQETAALALAQALETGEKAYSDLFGADRVKRLDETLGDELETLREQLEPLPNGARGYLEIEQAARMLAFRYASGGEEVEAAAQRAAAKLYGDHYVEAEFHDGRYRVPAAELAGVGEDRDDAMERIDRGLRIMTERGLDAAFETGRIETRHLVPQRAGQTEEEIAEQYRAHLQASGRWVTGEDERGLVLTDGQGAPVFMTDGQRVELRFWTLARAGAPGARPAPHTAGRLGGRPGLSDDELAERLRILGFEPFVAGP